MADRLCTRLDGDRRRERRQTGLVDIRGIRCSVGLRANRTRWREIPSVSNALFSISFFKTKSVFNFIQYASTMEPSTSPDRP